MHRINDILDLRRFPLDKPRDKRYRELVERCSADLDERGMFNLNGFLKADIAQRCADQLAAKIAVEAFTHSRRHNIYFSKAPAHLPAEHPALREFETTNHTLCADQLQTTPIIDIYAWRPLQQFLASVVGLPALYPMADPLASVNVMAYNAGEALNWHFDRSEFTTTLLLQAADAGGEFEYRYKLRDANNPNYDGVAKLLNGEDPEVRTAHLQAGTLNVFRGRDTPHRVTPVQGKTQRIIAVFSYFDSPGVVFSTDEQRGFYGRSAS